MSKMKDISGQKFGRLIALTSESKKGKRSRIYYSCKCDCGKELQVAASHLQSGHTQSCGCLKRERTSETHTTHGLCGTKEYRLWASIKQRCYDPNTISYANYGGRGITMFEGWKDDPEAFIYCLWTTIGPHPGDGYSIDRIDNDRGYVPGNLQWATAQQQVHNRRVSKHSSKYRGVCWCKRSQKWQSRCYMNSERHSLGYFATEEEAAAAVAGVQ